MPRYIDADALIADLEKAMLLARTNEEIADLKLCKEIVRTAPTVSPDDVRGVGDWIEDRMRIKCSVCGTDFNDEVTCCSNCYRWPWNYCPSCGAKMKGE